MGLAGRLRLFFRILLRGFGLVASRPQHPSAGPWALHPSPKFLYVYLFFFRQLPGKGQTEWFALCTPCSFFPDATVFPPKRMRGSRGKTFGWPPGRQVSKHSQEQKLNFCDGCRADGPAEGCWGREATNKSPRSAERRKPPRTMIFELEEKIRVENLKQD